ncbi:phospholipase A1 1-like [Ptychodera flava]|uniref:phospholipase A1 1-like n=1 Tax=Ptychodera flava TaxID=63121 RepID=UPI00396A1884
MNFIGSASNVDPHTIYRRAAATSQRVGAWLGQLAAAIKQTQPKIQIEGVGHSLGAHLLGKAGRSSRAFSRITGLDPAGPEFEERHTGKLLKSSDATLVDVIHTCGFSDGLSIPINHYGTLKPLGTVDFYPNYGYSQDGRDTFAGGSHCRVLDYFVHSIRHPGKFTTNVALDGTPRYNVPVFKTKKGRSEAEMGYHCKENFSGLYFISIAAGDVPFKYNMAELMLG